MVYLIVGLGNIGAEYAHTRHNIGFDVVDRIAEDAGAAWEDRRYGFITTVRVKNQTLLLLKPSTYMNLSGNAVRYWMRHITQTLGTQQYARLRFGIGNEFPRGGQVDFVLGTFEGDDLAQKPEALARAAEAVKSYALQGIERTMNLYNK